MEKSHPLLPIKAEAALQRIPEELRETLGVSTVKLNTPEDILRAGKIFLEYLEIESILVTLGEYGMCLFERDKEPFRIATKAQEVFDVSGAGDTVISVLLWRLRPERLNVRPRTLPIMRPVLSSARWVLLPLQKQNCWPQSRS